MINHDITNIRLTSSIIGWTMATCGLAIISCSTLFLISDMTCFTKQIINGLPKINANGTYNVFLSNVYETDVNLNGIILVLLSGIFGICIRVTGQFISSDYFIKKIEQTGFSRSSELESEPEPESGSMSASSPQSMEGTETDIDTDNEH